MNAQTISVVSIHADPARPLACDIKDVLGALGPHLPHWIWCVRNLDWLGENAEAVCRRVEAVAPGGIWMTSEELLDQARAVWQTIEGEFLAFPREVDPKTVPAQELNLGTFPESQAELAIVAVDGWIIEVYVKDSEVLASLKVLRDLRDEDPSCYF